MKNKKIKKLVGRVNELWVYKEKLRRFKLTEKNCIVRFEDVNIIDGFTAFNKKYEFDNKLIAKIRRITEKSLIDKINELESEIENYE